METRDRGGRGPTVKLKLQFDPQENQYSRAQDNTSYAVIERVLGTLTHYTKEKEASPPHSSRKSFSSALLLSFILATALLQPHSLKYNQMMFSHSILVKVASVLAVANLLASAVDVPFGEPLYKCTVENTFALTFDDGPSKTLTPKLLDTLKLHDFKATFFVNGENTGILANEGALLKRMIDEGHQIASHAWV